MAQSQALARASAAQKLKDTLTGLSDAYHALLDIAEIKDDKQTTTREGFQATVHATALVEGAQTLLGIAAELQLSRALGGPGGAGGEGGGDDAVDVENAANTRHCAASRATLVQMRGDITALLNELEEHYYSSSEHEQPQEQPQEQQQQQQEHR